MSLTIFEGPDGAGKTTLIAAWQRRLEGKGQKTRVTAHGTYLGVRDLAPVYLEDCVRALSGEAVLMDRSWLSEAVYGPIMRGENRIDVASRRMLERAALAASAVVVRCLPPFETCRKNYLARKHLEYLPNDHYLRAVYDMFTKQSCDLQSVIFDYTQEPSKIAFTDVVEYTRRDPNPGPGVGNFYPGAVTLLVGEQVSEPTASANLPWISHSSSGCTAWLSRLLEEWGVLESNLYWVNALTPRGTATQAGPWLELLKPKRVVALGTVAAAWCLDNNLAPEVVAHPQFWRRFNHSKPYPLKELLT